MLRDPGQRRYHSRQRPFRSEAGSTYRQNWIRFGRNYRRQAHAVHCTPSYGHKLNPFTKQPDLDSDPEPAGASSGPPVRCRSRGPFNDPVPRMNAMVPLALARKAGVALCAAASLCRDNGIRARWSPRRYPPEPRNVRIITKEIMPTLAIPVSGTHHTETALLAHRMQTRKHGNGVPVTDRVDSNATRSIGIHGSTTGRRPSGRRHGESTDAPDSAGNPDSG
ncbi:hypothetical protein NITHO_1680002 [Nitrolancea hollandica Lb]|uniref:Uncharacterized protein n=1 Tax=Nitrolancea hollandica Lb TaxID=1129897 RepID=I4EE18_9BACT|nr:hypothetical protein NITHO_1680002 [Nitrolancea hollandica Lb]